MSLAENLAWNVYAERKYLGISQRMLARAAGLDHMTIGYIENQKHGVYLKTVELIAEALNIDPLELLRPRNANTQQDSSSSEVEHSGEDS